MITEDVALATLDTFTFASPAEWRRVCARNHNILLEGPQVSTDAIVAHLKPYLGKPIAWHRPGMALRIPRGTEGALVVRNVAALTAPDQVRLLQWLSEPGDHHVVSTTREPLFSWVALKEFDETLYYRLNVVQLRVDAQSTRPGAGIRSHVVGHDRAV